MIFVSKIHSKMVLTVVALLFGFVGFSSSVLAANCSKNCLTVYSIQLADLGSRVSGTVKLVDETGSGGGARGAVVHAIWTRPDGSMFDQYANIGTRLRAEFSIYTAGVPGTYKLTVAGATKPGYKFDPKPGTKLSKSITIAGSGNQPPTAVANASALSGGAPLTVIFDSSGSVDPDGDVLTYAWNFGDGDSSGETNPTHTYMNVGNFTATLTVTDDAGASANSSVSIAVTDSNAGCTANCMSVDQISLRYRKKSGAITAQVWIYDENSNLVKNAGVRAVWTLPDGSMVDDYSETNSRSRAKFTRTATGPGDYVLTIVEVVKDGFTFDPENSNVLTGVITVKP